MTSAIKEQAHTAETRACRHCRAAYEPKPYQIKKGDYECPVCLTEQDRIYREARRDSGNPLVSGRVSPEKYRAWSKQYGAKPEVRARRSANMKRYRNAPETREHHLARDKTGQAISSGKLVRQPCEVCGATPTHAHHPDYSKPLEVQWLCPPCHRAVHARATGAAK